jgi:hypothetical protein
MVDAPKLTNPKQYFDLHRKTLRAIAERSMPIFKP